MARVRGPEGRGHGLLRGVPAHRRDRRSRTNDIGVQISRFHLAHDQYAPLTWADVMAVAVRSREQAAVASEIKRMEDLDGQALAKVQR